MTLKKSLAILFVFLTLIFPLTVFAASAPFTRVSVSSSGVQGNNFSVEAQVAGLGKFVVYTSLADNLVPNDTPNTYDIFLYERQSQITTRVSENSSGIGANDFTHQPAISDNGCQIVYTSQATNLIANDVNGKTDIFLYDCNTGLNERISEDSNGIGGNGHSISPAISGDGNVVVYSSQAVNLTPNDINGRTDIFHFNRTTNVTTRISVAYANVGGYGNSHFPDTNGDGSIVVFESESSNLIPNDTNGAQDIYLYDLTTNTMEIVSVDSTGTQGINGEAFTAAISHDGNVVGFNASFTNLVANDTNNRVDTFVRDLTTNVTERVSIRSDGNQQTDDSFYSVSLSENGSLVLFDSEARNLGSVNASFSGDVYLHNRNNDTTDFIPHAVGSSGRSNNISALSDISRDGSVIAFISVASDLIVGDTNNVDDIFVHESPITPTSIDLQMIQTQQATAFGVFIIILLLTLLTVHLLKLNKHR